MNETKERVEHETEKIYYTAGEISELLGVSIGKGYELVKNMNQSLSKAGYLTISGKVPARYFREQWYGLDKAD